MEIASVLVADGEDAFCAAITALVARAGLAVRRARTGDDALRLAAIQRPSVVVLDVALRGPSGFETCRELREIFGEGLPILFVSADRTEPTDRVAGLMLGADDYLVKPVDPDELLARIRRAAVRSSAASRWANVGPQPAADGPSATASAAGLTPREIEVLRLISQGRTPQEVSEQLVISPKTVSSHLQRILAKLGVHSRLQAVARAYELGLVSPAARAAEESIVTR